MVRALDRKLLRDLWALKMQVLSIALVIACGIGGFIGSLSTHESLMRSRDHYYATARFPHVFASAMRAPAALEERIRDIAGVTEVETRVVKDTQLSLPDVAPPIIARLIGVDFAHRPAMNRLTLTAGRWPTPGSRDEAVIDERFFTMRALKVGNAVDVLLNGRQERIVVTGTVLTPEYIYATRGTGMPDDEWFAVIWIDAKTLSGAYDMEGAFNSALVRLSHGASQPAVIAAVDDLLEPYGGLGAVGREDQPSDRIVTQEINQQKVFGTVLPAIFFLVAAFILNVVLHRLVNTQRPEIAALKALGYADRRIAAHFLAFASVIVAVGLALGLALGIWFGSAMTRMYTGFFHFPEFEFVVSPALVLAGAAITLVAAMGGTLAAIRGVVRQRAAEALRPPAPAQFRPLLVERLGYERLLTPAQRMVMRNLERKPLRAAITVAGIAGAVSILLAGIFWGDSLEQFIDVEFNKTNRGHVQVAFAQAVPRSVRFDLARLPGVEEAEVTRAAAVRLRAAHRGYRAVANGVEDRPRLLQMVDGHAVAIARPSPDGVVLTARLAERLGVREGDRVRAEFLEGKRHAVDLRVAGEVREIIGMNAWMRLDDLNAAMGEGDLVSAAQLRVDAREEGRLLAALKEVPAAAVVVVNRSLLATFRRTQAHNVLFFTTVLTAFAVTIAVGVVYNNARIQLAERAWELATLRVLGFTRPEVSVLLLGELGVEIAAAIPVGLAAGYGLVVFLLFLMPHEVLELPLAIYGPTYLYSCAAIALAGVASALVVRNRINRLDLVAVLKTRE